MKSLPFRYLPILGMILMCGLSTVRSAGATQKSAPVKSVPAKPAPPAEKQAAGAAGSGTASHSGFTTSGHSGTTMGSPAGHTGPTTNHPGGRSTTTTDSPSAHGATTTSSSISVHPGPRPGGPSGISRTATGSAAPRGARTETTAHGAVTRRPDGRISDVHNAGRGMDIHHGLDGSRRISVERADHSRIVGERGRRGYVERRYSFHGHDYGRRAYYWHGHEYNRFYRGYYYHGVYLGIYAPGFYFAPGFYGWAYNPWCAPVAYDWGWAGSPWYGYYGYYFAPAPVYAGPPEWLADYVVSADLQNAYAARQADGTAGAAPSPAGQPMITPEVRRQIADEVREQIALENSEAQLNTQGQEPNPDSSSVNRTFNDGTTHVFVVNSSLDVVDSSGNECALSDGDVLRTTTPPPGSATDASVFVVASKDSKECPTSSTVTVAVADLQEMQNGLRETVDQGLQELQSNQGKNGLPGAPASAMAPPVLSAFAQAAPPPEANGEADINAQLAAADQAEKDAASSGPAGVNPAAAPAPPLSTVSITEGQTTEQVTAALGKPLSMANVGPKKIYKYKDIKVTFKDDKVVDVE